MTMKRVLINITLCALVAGTALYWVNGPIVALIAFAIGMLLLGRFLYIFDLISQDRRDMRDKPIHERVDTP